MTRPGQEGATGTLWIVATPLGNLGDISPRATQILREAAVAYAEDTRHSRKLLQHLGIQRPLRALHDHNERARSDEALAALAAGQGVCLISDAGTPALSDPGARLVDAALAAGCAVSPIPGPSALAAALSVAGFPQDQTDVLFLGFLPTKGKARTGLLARIADHTGVVVLYEAPHRLEKTLAALSATCGGERVACVCRELTKMHEEVRRATLADLAADAATLARGESTLVIGPRAPAAPQDADEADAAVDDALRRCLDAGLTPRDAASAVAALLDRPRRAVYSRCVALTQEG